METIKHGLHSVTLYDDPECLPADNYYRFNKYLLLESSLGSSVEDFSIKHINIIYTLINADKKQEAITEINNLRQLFFQTLNEVNMAQMAFACLIHSIDGMRCEDYSESGLRGIIERIGRIGITQKELKKKQLKYQITLSPR